MPVSTVSMRAPGGSASVPSLAWALDVVGWKPVKATPITMRADKAANKIGLFDDVSMM